MDTSFRLFPHTASSGAPEVDQLYWFITAVSVFFTALICALIVYFAFKYRRGSRADRTIHAGRHYWWVEVTWSLIPLVLVMIMFAWGARVYFNLYVPPPNCTEITVVGKQWMWKAQHPNGRIENNNLHVPAGENIMLRMISEDVIHSYYVPAFRTKKDVLPGRYTTLWFRATRPGEYHIFCAEYCGTSHAAMRGVVHVMDPEAYARWLEPDQDEAIEAPAAAGERLFSEFRCGGCHDPGKTPRSPSLAGIFGRQVQLDDGSIVAVDEEYLRRAILEPGTQVRAGYHNLMPTFRGQIGEEGVLQLIAYLKSLREEPAHPTEPAASSETDVAGAPR